MTNDTLTSVAGIQVGHAEDLSGLTGCTVILCPAATTAAVDQRGGAPGTRETDLLRPSRLVQHVDAILLTGGSAYGLAAADGVVRWLEEHGRGLITRAGRVPIVPAAVVYDLEVGSAKARPNAAMGRAACDAASGDPVQEGSVGAGTGCRVGSLRGNPMATKGGIGSAAVTIPATRGDRGVRVAALFAVNAFGDILDDDGSILAGLREAPTSPRFEGTLAALTGMPPGERGQMALGGAHTVIGVLATDASLDRDALGLVASMAQDGIANAVRPAHTLYDGDTIFALATGVTECIPSLVGAWAAEVTAAAIRRAVRRATGLGGIPAARELAAGVRGR